MDVHRAYCSAVDRNVPVVLKYGSEPLGPVAVHDPSDLVCLDYKVRCTGWMCPLFSVSDDPELVAAAGAPSPGPTAAGPGDHPGTDPSRPAKRWSRPT